MENTLFYEFETERKAGLWVHIHLGLFGRFRNRKKPRVRTDPQYSDEMTNATRCVDLSGPTRCEVLDHRSRPLLSVDWVQIRFEAIVLLTS